MTKKCNVPQKAERSVNVVPRRDTVHEALRLLEVVVIQIVDLGILFSRDDLWHFGVNPPPNPDNANVAVRGILFLLYPLVARDPSRILIDSDEDIFCCV